MYGRAASASADLIARRTHNCWATSAPTRVRVEGRLEREVAAFNDDHQTGITKTRAMKMLRSISSALNTSDEDNLVRAEIASIETDFMLASRPADPVSDFPAFREKVLRLPHLARLNYHELADTLLKDRTSTE